MKEITGFVHHSSAVPYPYLSISLAGGRCWVVTSHAIVTGRVQCIDTHLIKEVSVTKMDSVWLVSFILIGDIDVLDVGYIKDEKMAHNLAEVLSQIIQHPSLM